MNPTSSELRALTAIRAQYEADGYTVELEPQLPSPFEGFVADAVATKQDVSVLIELRPREMTLHRRERLNMLAEFVESQPGWRIDVVTFDPSEQAPIPPEADARRRLDEARAIFEISPDAAILLTWSAIEAGLWKLNQTRDQARPPRPGSPRRLVRELFIDGLISDGQAAQLDDLAQDQNRVAHGWDVTSRRQLAELDWLIDFAQDLLNGSIATVDAMVDWFHAHYESPDDAAIPYDSREGGYQWLGKVPLDAADILQNNFPNALEQDRSIALESIETDGILWLDRRDVQ